jgi:hypothetical protein
VDSKEVREFEILKNTFGFWMAEGGFKTAH